MGPLRHVVRVALSCIKLDYDALSCIKLFLNAVIQYSNNPDCCCIVALSEQIILAFISLLLKSPLTTNHLQSFRCIQISALQCFALLQARRETGSLMHPDLFEPRPHHRELDRGQCARWLLGCSESVTVSCSGRVECRSMAGRSSED